MYDYVKKLYNRFKQYCFQIPVLGFITARYDINLVKGQLLRKLDLTDNGFVVKRNNQYLCINTDKYRFLDISQYLAPGSSYAKFLKAFQVEESKSFFPYEWFDCVDKLDATHLPPYECFYSELKNNNVLEAEYLEWENSGRKGNPPKTGYKNYTNLLHIWNENKMTKFEHFLIYYNNMDCGPFVEAVINFQKLYKENNLDVLKIAISAPGIARKMLFDCAKTNGVQFPLFSQDDFDLYKTVKQNIVGGPSNIFKGYHKTGETFLRNDKQKLCKSIVGYDAVALYLWAIGQEMPTTAYSTILCRGKFFKIFLHVQLDGLDRERK